MEGLTQAVIAAGGFGTRLRPLTDTMPKPMVPVLGKPMLEWNVEQFKKHGVKEFFITLHYLPGNITEHFGDGSRFGVSIKYFMEQEPLGNAGALKQFESVLEQHFFYLYGDVMSMMNYTKMAEAYTAKGSPIGMERMKRTDDSAGASMAELDPTTGRVLTMHAKSEGQSYLNAYRARGVFILDKKILSYIPENKPFGMGKDLIPAVIAAGENFYAYECDEYSKGVDTLEKLQEVEIYLKTHEI